MEDIFKCFQVLTLKDLDSFLHSVGKNAASYFLSFHAGEKVQSRQAREKGHIF